MTQLDSVVPFLQFSSKQRISEQSCWLQITERVVCNFRFRRANVAAFPLDISSYRVTPRNLYPCFNQRRKEHGPVPNPTSRARVFKPREIFACIYTRPLRAFSTLWYVRPHRIGEDCARSTWRRSHLELLRQGGTPPNALPAAPRCSFADYNLLNPLDQLFRGCARTPDRRSFLRRNVAADVSPSRLLSLRDVFIESRPRNLLTPPVVSLSHEQGSVENRCIKNSMYVKVLWIED